MGTIFDSRAKNLENEIAQLKKQNVVVELTDACGECKEKPQRGNVKK